MINSFRDEYFFLSNFYLIEIKHDGLIFPSVEHAYQANKSITYPQKKMFAKLDISASGAKKIGNRIDLRNDWIDIKKDIMLDLIRIKFKDKELKEKLLDTGNELLIEGNNWHDNYWGDCWCNKCKNIEGFNNLGKILMQVRDELRNELRDSELINDREKLLCLLRMLKQFLKSVIIDG